MLRVTAKKTRPTLKNATFDLRAFLDTSGAARRIEKFRGSERIYSQGDPARDVKYIQTGGVKLSVTNQDGREAVVAILEPGDFLAKDARQASRFA
jgi:CRP/FNR family transcriptional regulator, cyclic AMP receptor protein